jgi:hypothetical protein
MNAQHLPGTTASSASTRPHDDVPAERALTWRSLALGLLVVLLATLGGFYARHILHTTRLAQNHLSLAVVFPFSAIVLFLRRPLRLTRGELLVVFSMGLVASTLPTYFLSKLIANLTVPYYLADPTNGWAEYTHAFLPAWAVVEPGPGLTWFFEGLPSGASIPWELWVGPLFWWTSLVAAVSAILLCTVVILRRQWIEHERIDYPLMELPLAMLEDGRSGRVALPPFMRRPAFWVGFGISIFGILWNIISYFSPHFPTMPRNFGIISLGREFEPIRTNLYWPIVGFAYFLKLDIAFSIWFFYLLAVVQEGLLNRFGVYMGERIYYGTHFVGVGWQTTGVWLVLVAWGLWMARAHLRNVCRKAFLGDPTVDDSDELMSYRVAVIGLILGTLYLAGWLVASGMAPGVVFVFLILMMVVYLGITRIIVEAGLITIRAPMVAQYFVMYTFGTIRLSGPTMTSLGMAYGWHGDMKTTLMPALAHGARLFDTVRSGKRQLLWAPILALIVGVSASVLFTIYMAYRTGAGNYGGQLSGMLARLPWDIVVRYSRSPVETDWTRMVLLGAGVLLTSCLYAMRYRFPWWPLHPLGLAAGPVYPVTHVVFPLFWGWAAKLAILRYGGSRMYRVARPFFLGLILGYYVGAGLSFFVDTIWFPGQGHSIPFTD